MRTVALLALLLMMPLANTLAQAKPGQVMANVPTQDGEIAIANGTNNHVLVTAKETTISIDAEEGLKVAEWLKRSDETSYTGSGPIGITRQQDEVILTLTPGEGEPIKLRLDKEQATLFGMALASARQNVSEAGKN